MHRTTITNILPNGDKVQIQLISSEAPPPPVKREDDTMDDDATFAQLMEYVGARLMDVSGQMNVHVEMSEA